MAAGSAEALFLGKPPFDDIHDAPLRIIVSFGSHYLVCRPTTADPDVFRGVSVMLCWILIA
jgi:hypothetical protein